MLKLEPKYDLARRARVMVLESHETPFWKDGRQLVDLCLRAGANAIRFPATAWCVTYWPSSHLPPYPGLGDRDLLGDVMQAAGGTGVTVVPYNHVGVFHTAAYREHPQWAARTYDGVPLRWPGARFDGGIHYTTCLSNPFYREAYTQAMMELVARYDVEAMYFDGPVNYVVCQCAHCRKLFDEAYGFQLPRLTEPIVENWPHADWPLWEWGDETLLMWFELRYRTTVEFMRALNQGIKSVKDIPILFNTTVEQYGGRRSASMPERVMEHAEGCLAAEVHRPPRATPGYFSGVEGGYVGIVAQTKIGVAIGKAAWCYCPPGYHWNLTTDDSLDTLLYGYTYLALGGTPIVKPLHGFLHDEDGLPVVRQLFELAREHESYFYDFEALPFVGLLYSRATGDGYARERPVEKFSEHWHGAFRALTYSHQQVMPLLDRDLTPEGLADVRVLYLENVACLSDAQAEAIRAFVSKGGGLVATYESSLYDERGRKRHDFALADLFGVNYRGAVDWDGDPGVTDLTHEAIEAYLRTIQEHPVTEGIRPGKLVDIGTRRWRRGYGQFVISSKVKQGLAVCELYVPIEGAYGAPFQFPYGRPPGVVVNEYGEGRVAYVAAALGRQYNRWESELARRLVDHAVRWVSRGGLPFEIEAPDCVLAHMTRERNGKRTVLHLINYTGNMYETAAHRVHTVAPLANLKVKVRVGQDRELQSIVCLSTGDRLDFAMADGYACLSLPELKVWESILLQYG